jgi:hypothetical protein
VIGLALVLLAGCESKQQKAIDAAKKQAAATGQPQQVVTVAQDGSTTTTTIQPPVQGQSGQVVSTTTQPAQKVPGQPPPEPGVYYQPAGTAQAGAQQQQAVAPGQTAAAPAESEQAAAGSAGAAQNEPAPVVRPEDVDVPAGAELAIEINQEISTRTTPPGSGFSGEIAEPWRNSSGQVVLPRGVHVEGRVVASHSGGHFAGESLLELRLTSLTLNGKRYALDTHDVVRELKGKGKRSAGFIGGGAGLGMILGAIAGGGRGAAIGGLAGAGAGTAGAGLTDNKHLDIPAESIVHFRLRDRLTLQ